MPERIRNHRELEVAQNDSATRAPEPEEWPSLSDVEGRYVARVLGKTGGNKQAASRVLGVDRKTLNRMISRHQISLNKNGGDQAGTK